MFKKIGDFMEKPVTWGGYWKLCGVALIVSWIGEIICFTIFRTDKFDKVLNFIDRVKVKTWSIFHKREIEEELEKDYELV